MLLRPILACAFFGLSGMASGQITLRVPGHYPTIQQAIVAASPGDTVLVSSGTYPGVFHFLGKDILVTSVGGSSQTTIDGFSAGTVVSFTNGESSAAVLNGFTIQNGAGDPAGGIYCYQSSPTISNCVFLSNVGGNAGAEGGSAGAICCRAAASPTIENCIFVRNRGGDHLNTNGYEGGPGVLRCASSSAPTLRDCTFRSNVGGDGLGSSSSDGGPGVLATASNSTPLFEDCVFESNQGGSSLVVDGGAGAIHAAGGGPPPVFMNSLFADNRGGNGNREGGAGVFECYASGSPLISQCTLRNNVGADSTGSGLYDEGGPGVARCSSGATPTFSFCTILENRGGDCGTGDYDRGGSGVLYASSSAAPRLESCVVTDNQGGLAGAGTDDWGGPGVLFVDGSSEPVLLSSLFARNRGGSAGTSPTGGFEARDRSGPGAIIVAGLSGSLQVSNCTFVLNEAGPATPTAGTAGAMRLNTRSRVRNSIIWGNIATGSVGNVVSRVNDYGAIARLSYCCLEEPWPADYATANIIADPLLVNASNGDYHLSCDSPCIDAGNNGAPFFPAVDLDGAPRVIGGQVDLGADEWELAALGQNYCVATINSSGFSSVMSAFGIPSVSWECFLLSAEGIPGTPGLFFYGPSPIQVTFGDGFRCVGGAIRRFPPSSSSNGVLTREVNLANTPISANSTWYFQAWFRDGAAGGSGFNLSDGISVDFTQ